MVQFSPWDRATGSAVWTRHPDLRQGDVRLSEMRNHFISFFHLESDARRNQEQDKSEEEENLEPVGGEPDIPDLV